MTTGRNNEGIWSVAVCPNSVATSKLKYKTSLNPFEIPFLNIFWSTKKQGKSLINPRGL